MDQEFIQNLTNTLQSITAPDTDAIQRASKALQSDFYQSPIIIPALIHILQNHPEANIRQLAGVEARKLINYRWNDTADDIRAQSKSNLLQSAIAEPNALVRHTSSRVISAIATQELQDNEWPELLPALSNSVRSSSASEREVAVYVLYTLLEADLSVLSEHIGDLLELFSQSINDPESLQVRVSTIMALGEISSVLSSFSGQSNREVELFRSTVPSMVEVLKQVIEADDEKSVSQIFEVFSFLLVTDATLTSKYFADLINFVLNGIAAEKQLSDEFRIPALQYLINAVRSKKMKIQALKLGPSLVSTAMDIISNYYRENEADLDEDDEDSLGETNPANLALQLIDTLSSHLPPVQVNAPLLEVLMKYAKAGDTAELRAGFMSLAYAAEGAPDFYATQLSVILPIIVAGLQSSDPQVVVAALFCLHYMGNELNESISDKHETLLPLVFNVMDNATVLKVGKNACSALSSILQSMEKRVITEKYLDSLVPKLLHLFNTTTDLGLKSLIVTAISSAAFSSGKNFLPYFESTMKTLEPFISMTQNMMNLTEQESNLCGSVLDTVGVIAASVGKEAFQPFVEGLVEASYKCLQTTNNRVKESAFISIGTLAKIYGEEFAVVVPKILPEVYKCLDQNEFGDLNEGDFQIDDDNLGEDAELAEALTASSAIAMEKEYATDTLTDLICASKSQFPDIIKAISYFCSQIQHYSDGLRNSSLHGLWKSYETWVACDNEGAWAPGLPVSEHANEVTAAIASQVRSETLDILEQEEERVVVITICNMLTEGLKKIGPRVFLNAENLERLSTQINLILNKQHKCQAGVEDDVEDTELAGESAEYDEVLVDSAFDVAIQIGAALGSQFLELFSTFVVPILKYFSSSSNVERAAAVGAIGEMVLSLKGDVTPLTEQLMKNLLHRLSDYEIEVRSNAAYGIGLLCFYSEDTETVVKSYPTILEKLQRLLKKVDKAAKSEGGDDDNNARGLANACGCVSRMIMKHPQNVPVSDVVNVLLNRLPLTDGLEENTPVLELIFTLVKEQEPTILERRQDLVNILAQMFEQEVQANKDLVNQTLGVDEIQFPFETDEIRSKTVELLKFLEQGQSGLVSSVPILAEKLSS